MLCFPMLISSLPSANPLLPEHKIGIFVLGMRWFFEIWRGDAHDLCFSAERAVLSSGTHAHPRAR